MLNQKLEEEEAQRGKGTTRLPSPVRGGDRGQEGRRREKEGGGRI